MSKYINDVCVTDPVSVIYDSLRIKRPVAKIKDKLLELGLVEDRKALRKKRAKKSNVGKSYPFLVERALVLFHTIQLTSHTSFLPSFLLNLSRCNVIAYEIARGQTGGNCNQKEKPLR